MWKLAVFVSGSGSNAENIINHFKENEDVEVSVVLSDNAQSFGLQRAKKHSIEAISFSRHDFLHTDKVINILNERAINYIILAGFLCFVPENIINNYRGKIVNIHPSLLPKHGGKGMYGHFVHEAVIKDGDKESGITVHHVNEHFDDGEIIFQAKCKVLPTDEAEDVERKVRALEIEHFPSVIERELNKKKDEKTVRNII